MAILCPQSLATKGSSGTDTLLVRKHVDLYLVPDTSTSITFFFKDHIYSFCETAVLPLRKSSGYSSCISLKMWLKKKNSPPESLASTVGDMAESQQRASPWEVRGWWLSFAIFICFIRGQVKTEDCHDPCAWFFTDTFFNTFLEEDIGPFSWVHRPIFMGTYSVNDNYQGKCMFVWVCTKQWE